MNHFSSFADAVYIYIQKYWLLLYSKCFITCLVSSKEVISYFSVFIHEVLLKKEIVNNYIVLSG